MENSKVIKLKEKVTVYSTDLDKHHETGAEIKVHPEVAKKLIANGMATEAPKKTGGK